MQSRDHAIFNRPGYSISPLQEGDVNLPLMINSRVNNILSARVHHVTIFKSHTTTMIILLKQLFDGQTAL
jgi:hypothetical protein